MPAPDAPERKHRTPVRGGMPTRQNGMSFASPALRRTVIEGVGNLTARRGRIGAAVTCRSRPVHSCFELDGSLRPVGVSMRERPTFVVVHRGPDAMTTPQGVLRFIDRCGGRLRRSQRARPSRPTHPAARGFEVCATTSLGRRDRYCQTRLLATRRAVSSRCSAGARQAHGYGGDPVTTRVPPSSPRSDPTSRAARNWPVGPALRNHRSAWTGWVLGLARGRAGPQAPKTPAIASIGGAKK